MKNRMIGIIPARIGSKGVPKKNIKKVGGIPLISWTIRTARKSNLIDELYISTDDEEIAYIAEKEGCKVPFIRPKNISADSSKTSDLVIHAIDNLKFKNENIILLQPTSPLRRTIDIENSIQIFYENKNCYSVVSMVDANLPREIQYRTSKNGYLKKVYPSLKPKFRRQDCEIIYKPNGAIYIFNSNKFYSKKVFISKESIPYNMPIYESLDIDKFDDFHYLEYLCEKNTNIIPKVE